jgi:DNA-3-methyladenine glycosylase II
LRKLPGPLKQWDILKYKRKNKRPDSYLCRNKWKKAKGKNLPAYDTMHVIHLNPHPPYDFSLSAAIFAVGDPQIRIYQHNIFRQALEVGGTPVLVEVFSEGSVEAPKLNLSLLSDTPLSKSGIKSIHDLVSSMFNINEDITPFYEAMENDAIMSSLTSQLRGLKAPTTPTVFEALVDSVTEQQISLKAAHSIEHRLIRASGNSLTIGSNTFYCYPTPEILSIIPDSTFRSCGLTLRKGEYIRGISQQIVAGTLDLDHLKTYPDTESIISELVQIRGVGRWTAELTILRGMHRADAFPADDIGVRRFISQFYRNGRKTSSIEARACAERWGAWKGFAAYYLELADLLGINPGPPQSS